MNTSVAKIDLNCLRYNIGEYQKLLGDTTKIIAVVKADAYGHGVLPVCKAAYEAGIDFFAISRVKEGIELTKAGFKNKIIVLGGTLASEMPAIVEHGLIPTIYSIDQLKMLDKANAHNETKAGFHLKIDTGMNRLGVKGDKSLDEFLDVLDTLDNVSLEGVYSHFAVSDSDKEFTKKQLEAFIIVVEQINKRGYNPKTHISNSAATQAYDYCKLDYVRLGIGMYGLNPQDKSKINLKPVMSLCANIIHINNIEAGETVSYGRTYVATKKTKIAVLPIGYADGYPRNLSNKAQVLVAGKRCNIVGTVCMDHMMIDVTEIQNVATGDEVILIGKLNDEEITAKELADLAGTIHYEIVTGIQKRVGRVYIG